MAETEEEWMRMKGFPSLACRRCGMPMHLQFVEADAERRFITCPYCSVRQEWVVLDARDAVRNGEETDAGRDQATDGSRRSG